MTHSAMQKSIQSWKTVF